MFFKLTKNIRISTKKSRRLIKIFAKNNYNDFKSEIALAGIFNYFIRTNFSSLSQKHWEYLIKLDKMLDDINVQNQFIKSDDNFEIYFAFKAYEFYDSRKIVSKIKHFIDDSDRKRSKIGLYVLGNSYSRSYSKGVNSYYNLDLVCRYLEVFGLDDGDNETAAILDNLLPVIDISTKDKIHYYKVKSNFAKGKRYQRLLDATYTVHKELPKKEGSVVKSVIFEKNNIEYDGWYSRLRLLELSMGSNSKLLKAYNYLIDINDEVDYFIIEGNDIRKKCYQYFKKMTQDEKTGLYRRIIDSDIVAETIKRKAAKKLGIAYRSTLNLKQKNIFIPDVTKYKKILSDGGYDENGYGLQALILNGINEESDKLGSYIDFDSEAQAITILIQPVKQQKKIVEIINKCIH